VESLYFVGMKLGLLKRDIFKGAKFAVPNTIYTYRARKSHF